MATQYNVSVSFAGNPPSEGVGLVVLVTDAATGAPVPDLGQNNFLIYAYYSLNPGVSESTYNQPGVIFLGAAVNFGARLPGVYAFQVNVDPRSTPPTYVFAVSVLGTLPGLEGPNGPPLAVVGVGIETFYTS
jgi:hypothetical protein